MYCPAFLPKSPSVVLRLSEQNLLELLRLKMLGQYISQHRSAPCNLWHDILDGLQVGAQTLHMTAQAGTNALETRHINVLEQRPRRRISHVKRPVGRTRLDDSGLTPPVRHERVRLARVLAEAANFGAGIRLQSLELGVLLLEGGLLASDLSAEQGVAVQEAGLGALEGLDGVDAALVVKLLVAGVGVPGCCWPRCARAAGGAGGGWREGEAAGELAGEVVRDGAEGKGGVVAAFGICREALEDGPLGEMEEGRDDGDGGGRERDPGCFDLGARNRGWFGADVAVSRRGLRRSRGVGYGVCGDATLLGCGFGGWDIGRGPWCLALVLGFGRLRGFGSGYVGGSGPASWLWFWL